MHKQFFKHGTLSVHLSSVATGESRLYELCVLSTFLFYARPDVNQKPMMKQLSTIQSSTPTNRYRHQHHTRSYLKTSSLMNSNSNLMTTHHQQLLSQLMRIENQKKESFVNINIS